MLVAEGPNHRIELNEGVATCRVWRRPDLSLEEGAACAAAILGHIRSLAVGDAAALILDLSEAPDVVGPKTEESLKSMLSAFEIAEKPIAVLVGQGAVRRLQLGRFVGVSAPAYGELLDNTDAAEAWVRARIK